MKTAIRIGTLLLLAELALASAYAQDERANTPAEPAPPLYQEQSTSKPQPEEVVPDVNVPDSRPLTGALLLGLGSSDRWRSFLVPSLHFAQSVDSNPAVNDTSSTNFRGVSTISGSLELQRRTSAREMTLHYSGGGTFFDGDSNAFQHSTLNSSYHELGFSQSFDFHRWSLLASDAMTYSPEATFGYGSWGNGFDYNRLGLQPGLLPSQTVLTQHSSRISNTVVGQVQYHLGPRSSLTASGAYGILHFPDGDFLDGNQINFSAGYNRQLTRRDTVGVAYSYGLFRYSRSPADLQSHGVQLMYGRRVTGRLSLQLSGGAQFYSTGNVPGSITRTTWSAGSSAQYRWRRTDLNLSYLRGVSGGSGVFQGATSDTVQVGASRPLTRRWETSMSFGYSHNADLSQKRSFDSQYVSVALHRSLGRYIGTYFSYSLQRQTSNVPCVGSCSNELLRHVFGFGFDWRFRPIRLD